MSLYRQYVDEFATDLPTATTTEIVLGSGRVDDAWFLVDQVAQGVVHQNFSLSQMLPSERIDLLKQCCSAMLSDTWHGFFKPVTDIGTRAGSTLLAARFNGKTIGAALVETRLRTGEVPVIDIDVVVVDESYRGYGVGKQLLQAIMSRAITPSRLLCACTPYSQHMIKMLAHAGFRKMHSAEIVNGLSTPNVYEHCKGDCTVHATNKTYCNTSESRIKLNAA